MKKLSSQLPVPPPVENQNGRKQQPPPLPPTPPLIPIAFSKSQPILGATLDTQSILRDLLERNLPPTLIKKL